MASKKRYLALYDIAHPRRLRQALYILLDYSHHRKKSVFECQMRQVEVDTLLNRIRPVINEDEDRFALIRLDQVAEIVYLGKGQDLASDFLYVG